MSFKRRLLSICCVIAVIFGSMTAQAFADDVQNIAINGPIKVATESILNPTLYKSGKDYTVDPFYKTTTLEVSDAPALIQRLSPLADGDGCSIMSSDHKTLTDTCVTVIHVLRWNSSDHSSAMSQHWYVYDPTRLRNAFYFASPQSRFVGTVITGRTKFRFIYIHLAFDLKNSHAECFKGGAGGIPATLNYPVNYKVANTKAQTQFFKDVTSLMSILGLFTPAVGAQADDPEVGYYSTSIFTSQYKTSAIAFSLGGTSSAKAGSTATPLATQTYTNEGPSWIGLSFAVPLTSYKNINYSQTNGQITDTSINQQNIYAVVDVFLPPVEPAWTTFRYVPHPIFGMPIKKQPLRNMTAGLAMGWHWVEPFGSVVFNVQQRKDTSGNLVNHLVFKGAWGINVSVSDVAKAIKSSSTSKTAASTASKSASTN